jgi:hypothetical protein
MPNPPSRLVVSIPTASFDGIFHGRYPHGTAPAGAVLQGAATDTTSASGALTAGGGGSTFDKYISTTGSDSNAGTLASPWAITAINTKQSTYAGLRVGLLPGTYDISSLMFLGNSSGHSPALMINGGPNSSTPTYIGSSNSGGTYQANTAILDAKGASGFYGGSNTNNSTILGSAAGNTAGHSATPSNWGNWIVDGLDFTGFSYWAVQTGSSDASGGLMPNTQWLNCRFYDSTNANAFHAGSPTGVTGGVHSGPMELYNYNVCLVSNCYFFNNLTNTGNDASHFAAITSWGFTGLGLSRGLTIQQCSFVQTSGLYGITDTGATGGTTVTRCYFDMSHAGAANGLPQGVAIMGFNGASSASNGLGDCFFTNNIVKGGGIFDGFNSDASQIWSNNITIANNTWDLDGGAGIAAAEIGFKVLEASGHTGIESFYNNLIYDNGFAGSIEYGYHSANSDIFALCDYNIYGSINNFFHIFGTNGSETEGATETFTGWKAAIGGLEAHSSTNATNPFTNVGAGALAYTVTSGPAFGTGRVGGTSGGAACNVGAWDGTVTQIGSTLPQPT